MIRLFCLLVSAMLAASSALAIGNVYEAKGDLSHLLSQSENTWRLAQGNPPYPGCKQECTPMKKCTPGPCKRVGDTMVCEKERCETFQSCGWVCPPKK